MVVKSECPGSSSGQNTAAVLSAQEPTPSFLKRSLYGCLSVATGTAKCIGRIWGGKIVADISSIPRSIALRKMHLSDRGFKNLFSCESIMKSFGETTGLDSLSLIGLIGVIEPIQEEILYRGIIQDVVLNRIFPYVLKKVMPGKETLLQNKIYTVARIALTSALFAASHQFNQGTLPTAYVQAQIVSGFVVGIILGVVKESNLGLLGAIAAHITMNTKAISSCIEHEARNL